MPVAQLEDEFTFLGNNRCRVLVPERTTDGHYTLMELTTPPGGGGNSLHTDPFLEAFYALDDGLEFFVERDGRLESIRLKPGEVVNVGHDVKHRFTCVADRPARALVTGLGSFERFFRALAVAWEGPWDAARTPAAVGPVFQQFGVQFHDSEANASLGAESTR